MNFVTIESEAYQELLSKMDAVHRELIRLQNPVKELSREWIDTHDVLQILHILHISRRTLSKYLKEGRIKYTKLENKNYFKLQDIEEFLKNGYGAHKQLG